MTVASTTLASHMSLMTGSYPHTHGVPRNGFVASDQNVTLAEALRRAGYVTAGFIAAFALDSRFNFAQGSDHYDEDFDILAKGRGPDQNERRAEKVTDAVIDYLDAADLSRSQFLFVHYFDPHMFYDPPPPYDQMYGASPGAIPIEPSEATMPRPWLKGYANLLSKYAGEISYMDAQFGRLLDYFRRRGVLDNALLIVTSDHGELFVPYRAKLFDHGWTVRQSEVHAVGIIRLPGGNHSGARLELPISSIDIAPTVLRDLGIEIPERAEGLALDLEDFSGIPKDRVRFAEATKPIDVEQDSRWFNNLKPRCVREGRYKFVSTPYRNLEALFDLSIDPYERRNLLKTPTPQFAERADRMRSMLTDWTDRARPLPTHFESKTHDDTTRRLRALGYLGANNDDDDPNDESP
jgi:arylsulfatase A-like enzyme